MRVVVERVKPCNVAEHSRGALAIALHSSLHAICEGLITLFPNCDPKRGRLTQPTGVTVCSGPDLGMTADFAVYIFSPTGGELLKAPAQFDRLYWYANGALLAEAYFRLLLQASHDRPADVYLPAALYLNGESAADSVRDGLRCYTNATKAVANGNIGTLHILDVLCVDAKLTAALERVACEFNEAPRSD